MVSENTLVLDCDGDLLPAILHCPETLRSSLGVVVVVGGPQYRVGSHRQFLLLARDLAERGIPVLRFDYRGMGDAEGAFRGFEAIGPDLAAAIEGMMTTCPELEGVVLWGLCDAASAALFYAPEDERVRGLVLLNPWVRTEAGAARAVVRHYYHKRVLSADFWKKLLRGGINPVRAVGGFLGLVRRSRDATETPEALPDRMASCLAAFEGPVLLLLSGEDLTADEFRDTVAASSRWRALLADPRVQRRDFPEANHTFSSAAWRGQVADCTGEWVLETAKAPHSAG